MLTLFLTTWMPFHSVVLVLADAGHSMWPCALPLFYPQVEENINAKDIVFCDQLTIMFKVLFHQAWSKTRGGRWFNKQEDLPAGIGNGRVFHNPVAIVEQAVQGLNNFAHLDLGVV